MQDLYLLKINDEELERMAGWVGCSTDEKTAAAALAAKYNIQLVCVTRGGKGAALWISEVSIIRAPIPPYIPALKSPQRTERSAVIAGDGSVHRRADSFSALKRF
jgi:sugar/nucleoside kinase (ribokinase family)